MDRRVSVFSRSKVCEIVEKIKTRIRNRDFSFEPALKNLIVAGWDINEKDSWVVGINYRHTLLHAIFKMKQYDLAFKSIALGASVNVENDSLACVAVEMGDIELLKKILYLGADIKGTDYWGKSVLCCACYYRRIDILEYLLENYVFTREELKECLYVVCELRGRLHVIDRLFKADPELLNDEESSFEALSRAAKKCVLSVIEFLVLKHGLNINSRSMEGKTCFMVNCTAKYVNKKLIELGADPNAVDHEGKTAFHYACQHKKPRTVDFLLSIGVDPFVIDKNNLTSLHWACLSGDYELVVRILGLGFNVTKMKTAKVGLMEAGLRNNSDNLKIVNLLMKNGVSINELNSNGENALFCYKFVEFFLKNGIDPHAVNNQGRNALINCIIELGKKNHGVLHQWLVVKLLISAKIDLNIVDIEGKRAIHYICSDDFPDYFDLFLKSGANIHVPTASGDYPLDLILKRNPRSQIVKRLEKLGFNYSKEECTIECRGRKCEKCSKMPCSLKTRCGHFVHISCLEKKGIQCPICKARITPYAKVEKYFQGEFASIESLNTNELLYLIENSIEDGMIDLEPILNILFDKETDRDLASQILRKACRFGRLDVLNHLHSKLGNRVLKIQADLLHLACISGNIEIIRWLLDQGLSIKTCNASNYAPLHVACYTGNVEVFDFLLENGADIEIEHEKSGSNLLHHACRSGHFTIVEKLLQMGFDVNSIDKNKDTPLHYLCSDNFYSDIWSEFKNYNVHAISISEEQRIEIAKLLLRYDADIDLRNANLHTPVEESCRFAKGTLFDFFLSKVKDPQNYFILPAAATSGNFEFFKKVLAIQLDPKKARPDGFNALMGACIGANLDIFKHVIKFGIDVNAVDSQNNTAFLYACSRVNEQMEIFETLVKKGANIHHVNKQFEGALHFAAEYLAHNIVKRLVELGVRSDKISSKWEFPVALVLKNEHNVEIEEEIVLEMVKALVSGFTCRKMMYSAYIRQKYSARCHGWFSVIRYLEELTGFYH